MMPNGGVTGGDSQMGFEGISKEIRRVKAGNGFKS